MCSGPHKRTTLMTGGKRDRQKPNRKPRFFLTKPTETDRQQNFWNRNNTNGLLMEKCIKEGTQYHVKNIMSRCSLGLTSNFMRGEMCHWWTETSMTASAWWVTWRQDETQLYFIALTCIQLIYQCCDVGHSLPWGGALPSSCDLLQWAGIGTAVTGLFCLEVRRHNILYLVS